MAGWGFSGVAWLRSGLRRIPSRFSPRGENEIQPGPAIDKHGATPHAARDNPYVVLLLTSPRIFDLDTSNTGSWIRAPQSGYEKKH